MTARTTGIEGWVAEDFRDEAPPDFLEHDPWSVDPPGDDKPGSDGSPVSHSSGVELGGQYEDEGVADADQGLVRRWCR